MCKYKTGILLDKCNATTYQILTKIRATASVHTRELIHRRTHNVRYFSIIIPYLVILQVYDYPKIDSMQRITPL